MLKSKRAGRVPVSTKKTFCVPFNIKQNGRKGYKVSECPVKPEVNYTLSFSDALEKLRGYKVAGWRDYSSGSTKGARQAVGWITESDANKLLVEKDDQKRVVLFESLSDVVE
ncbi:hypothetical protein ACOYR1_07555 [Thalassotalea piscium]